KMAELEADRFAGFMMGSRFRNLIGRADMLKVGRGLFENFESDELYPSVEERLEFLLLGWDESFTENGTLKNNIGLFKAAEKGDDTFGSKLDSIFYLFFKDSVNIQEKERFYGQFKLAKFALANSKQGRSEEHTS